jgi:catalase
MSDDDHPELDFDPLDDTKLWPADKFPWLPVGIMTLNKNPENYFHEVEQVAFGTGVLVDGLDFSDDKMLQGRTFSYSDTQRYRVGTNYLQLPINAPKKHVATNQRDGQMAYLVDTAPNQNRHVNYEPSSMNGLKEAPKTAPEHTPYVAGNLVRQPIDRTNNFAQAGERYRMFEDWERNDLINNLVSALKPAKKHIQDKMVELFSQCDEDYGRRVREGLQQGANGNGHSTIQADLQADQEVEAMAHSAQPY